MRARLRSWWFDTEGSLWFLPMVMTVAAVVMAFITVELDRNLNLNGRAPVRWFFGGGAEGARGVLGAIAGTMITVTGLVFSITVVALQLASSQLTPRVLRTFMGDRGNQTVLGFFIGTFTYALLVLRVVRSPLEDAGGFVPSISVTVAIGLSLISVALLIYFIHHSANSMRASVVIDRAAIATRELIDTLYPDNVGEGIQPDPPGWVSSEPSAIVYAVGGGYLQTINADLLFDLAERHTLAIRPAPFIGDFILPGEPLASIWPDTGLDDEVEDAIRDALVLGLERTLQADVSFGVQQLSDIAVKALSPGINDPTTAIICIGHLSEIIVLLANRGKPDEVRSSNDGSVRVILQGPPFAQIAGVAFDQIRHYGVGDPTVAEYLVSSLRRIAALIPPARRPTIVRHARLVLTTMRTKVSVPEDRARVERVAAWVTEEGDPNRVQTVSPPA